MFMLNSNHVYAKQNSCLCKAAIMFMLNRNHVEYYFIVSSLCVELIRDQPFNIHGGWIFSTLDQNIILTRSKKSDDFFSEYEKSVV
jgi:hypothetical protein